ASFSSKLTAFLLPIFCSLLILFPCLSYWEHTILATNCELLMIPETAARLRVNKNTVYGLIKKGYLKSIKLGCRKVSVRALAEFIERCEAGEIEL
ncbi:MAG: helix-turn-helix domain-containing protein, partial [Flavonifractor plautii]|nr:helix-turn-helix domain-containing protein [Flavonifractor plautii]MDU6292575.1 helix-turn-helix domain-containing protein [Flavonifractor plautii]MDU6345061.1 helix-turn-helix domain-containing protein [Flavonifractor plautii]